MIRVKFDSSQQFLREMTNIVGYAEGFVDGAKKGQNAMLENLGKEVIAELKNFIDINARVNPTMMHHVYEWYQTGSPAARLFDIEYNVLGAGGLSFDSNFRQSRTVARGSKTPFYDKARIMENGIPVTIRPKTSSVLAFEDNGETVFTKKPITVPDPGGPLVQGQYESVFNSFFNQYFSQSFLRDSKVLQGLEIPRSFVSNFRKSKAGGRSAGIAAGYEWMAKSGGM